MPNVEAHRCRRCVGRGEVGTARDLDGQDVRRARVRLDNWLERYQDKYPKTTACLARVREELLAFYDFPAVHWTHLRTTNVIESAFSPPYAIGARGPYPCQSGTSPDAPARHSPGSLPTLVTRRPPGAPPEAAYALPRTRATSPRPHDAPYGPANTGARPWAARIASLRSRRTLGSCTVGGRDVQGDSPTHGRAARDRGSGRLHSTGRFGLGLTGAEPYGHRDGRPTAVRARVLGSRG